MLRKMTKPELHSLVLHTSSPYKDWTRPDGLKTGQLTINVILC